jgi:hypothetical protein
LRLRLRNPAPYKTGVVPANKLGDDPTYKSGIVPAYKLGVFPANKLGDDPTYKSGIVPAYKLGVFPANKLGDDPTYKSGIVPAYKLGFVPANTPGTEKMRDVGPGIWNSVVGQVEDGQVDQLPSKLDEGVQVGELVLGQIYGLHLRYVISDDGEHLTVHGDREGISCTAST